MVKIIETDIIISAAPGTYATVIRGKQCLQGHYKLGIEHPMIVGWKISADEARAASPVFSYAVQIAPQDYHNYCEDFVFLHDHDGRLRWQGGQLFDGIEDAKAFAVSTFEQQWAAEGMAAKPWLHPQ